MPLKYPKIWSHELGETADVNELPETAEGTSGKASIRDLFPAITQVPLKAGGVAPARADFNALFKLLGDNIFFQQNGGVYIYSDKQNYYTNAVVWFQNKQYVALKDNGPAFSVGAKAPTDAGFWQEAIAPQLTPYTENEALIARALDKIGATSHAPAGTATATQLKTALKQILADLGAAAFLSKENVFNSTQRCNAALPESSFDNVLVTYAQALAIAKANAGTPTGALMPFAGKVIPEGYLLCNGAEVSRTTYANLFSVIGTLWGSGDGSTTFNLPDFNDRFIEGTTDTTKVGKKLEAGLPNIFSVIGTLWGSGDGSTTFNLPDFNDRFIEGTTDTTKVGKKLEAGLPNITSVIGTLWGSGDGSTTFNLPDFNDRFIEGTTDTTKVGKKLEAGLPNITGNSGVNATTGIDTQGAFLKITRK